ncbi:helix-turn-helix domain-containing protein [uncultured Megasphaera sp.]|uniref:helix-turn-helix domain-containing protein n=1 Tax=uncultured Megasphaera sp. TaxID=165188 RepID=UPI00345B595F
MREYLIEARNNAGLTQKCAADKLFISQNYLSCIERGIRQKDLKLSMLKCFSRVYDVPLQKLIDSESRYLKQVNIGVKPSSSASCV